MTLLVVSTGQLNANILVTLYHDAMPEYVSTKHGLTPAKLCDTHTDGLHKYMKRLKPHARASTSKLIHDWIPNQSFLHKQDRTCSSLCPCCESHPETVEHMYQCEDPETLKSRVLKLDEYLQALIKINTNIHIVETFEYKLSMVLNITYKKKYIAPSSMDHKLYTTLITAKRHQNILRWNYFLKGFISSYWIQLQTLSSSSPTARQSKWEEKITSLTINLLKELWNDRNTFVHGKTIQEARTNARAAVLRQVADLYKKPPTLAKRYACVTDIPIANRIKKPTAQLQQWLERIKHQIKVSKYLCNPRIEGQLTLHQAYNRAGFTVTEDSGSKKYPP